MEHDINALRAAVQNGSVRGDFPSSLLRQFDQRGSLSEKQWFWVAKLASEASAPRQAEQLPPFNGVLELFERARQHLKYPKIWLQFGDNRDPIRLHVAGERSRYAGSIQITDGTGFGGKYYGRVNADGRADLSDKNLTPNAKQNLVRVLSELAERPAEVAAAYGHLTGNCCFCHKSLTDERSTSVGYGPVCAKSYGLPWG